MHVNVWSSPEHKTQVWYKNYVTKQWRAYKMQGMFATIPFSSHQFDELQSVYHKCILYIQVSGIWCSLWLVHIYRRFEGALFSFS